jgi:hypothetical protein
MSKNKQLKDYQQKRDFRKTKEPQGTTSKKKEHIFVIQKHDASHLHYDFRLQNDNVLISWAIPKGLSTAANKKRLAIRTEDHPLDYALLDFPGNFIIDCELVAFRGKTTSFEQLQHRMHVKNPSQELIKKYPVYAYVFGLNPILLVKLVLQNGRNMEN